MDSTGRFAYWRFGLSEYKYNVLHHAGFKHQAADELFHHRMTREDHTPLERDLSILAIHVTKNEKGIRIIDGIATSLTSERLVTTVTQHTSKRGRDDF